MRKITTRLIDLPNIGKSIAIDLHALGIFLPSDIAQQDPLALYHALATVMGHRHDPCVLYTLLSVKHYLDHGEILPWWTFTAKGKKLLA